MLLGFGLTSGLNDSMHAHGSYTLGSRPGALPAGLAVGWISTWNWAFIFPLFPFLFLLFPDGRLPSRRGLSQITFLTLTFIDLAVLLVATTPPPPSTASASGYGRKSIWTP